LQVGNKTVLDDYLRYTSIINNNKESQSLTDTSINDWVTQQSNNFISQQRRQYSYDSIMHGLSSQTDLINLDNNSTHSLSSNPAAAASEASYSNDKSNATPFMMGYPSYFSSTIAYSLSNRRNNHNHDVYSENGYTAKASHSFQSSSHTHSNNNK
jgi:hypothetical protein